MSSLMSTQPPSIDPDVEITPDPAPYVLFILVLFGSAALGCICLCADRKKKKEEEPPEPPVSYLNSDEPPPPLDPLDDEPPSGKVWIMDNGHLSCVEIPVAELVDPPAAELAPTCCAATEPKSLDVVDSFRRAADGEKRTVNDLWALLKAASSSDLGRLYANVGDKEYPRLTGLVVGAFHRMDFARCSSILANARTGRGDICLRLLPALRTDDRRRLVAEAPLTASERARCEGAISALDPAAPD